MHCLKPFFFLAAYGKVFSPRWVEERLVSRAEKFVESLV
jgi:hypothetical protein